MEGTAVSKTTQDVTGIACIKTEYILRRDDNLEPSLKKVRLDEESQPGIPKKRGQFKNRYKENKKHFPQVARICSGLIDLPEEAEESTCDRNDCKSLHDVTKFLETKPPDVAEECPVYSLQGYCPWGITCRFSGAHTTQNGRNKRNTPVIEQFQATGLKTLNSYSKDLNMLLRKKKYDFSKSIDVLKKLPNCKLNGEDGGKEEEDKEEKTAMGVELTSETTAGTEEPPKLEGSGPVGPCSEEDLFKLHLAEKKRIAWPGKLYLSPLTTLGNLPFRRICKEFGADITCSEMAMATSILQTQASELALLKRHETEDLFGVQLCGNNPYALTRCAQLLEETVALDFIDVNLGCPIDAVYQKGGGSGLLRREKVLDSIVKSMARVTSLPLTIKTRTGVQMGKNVAHRLMPLFAASGVSLVTVHGRSREQRYTRTPDWTYVEECAQAAAPTPVFGNGDVLSYHDYNTALATCPSISGVMIGRGALYKPWLFTEIKEQRDWDISSSERFEIIKKYVHYGLGHWGSDTRGVERTRKFLLEWLSFLYRYIPIGLLERPPQKINARPPRYVGRDDLETLMASTNCADWVRISEMLLGPVPEGFHFLPKHKANSWA